MAFYPQGRAQVAAHRVNGDNGAADIQPFQQLRDGGDPVGFPAGFNLPFMPCGYKTISASLAKAGTKYRGDYPPSWLPRSYGTTRPTGRARWKIENENNNTLKTEGHHFEHHYGHGNQFLSSLLATPVLLAYLLHTLLDVMDNKSHLPLRKLPRQLLLHCSTSCFHAVVRAGVCSMT